MARTATKTANILSELYEETFCNDTYEPFRIAWADLRGIAGVAKLSGRYLDQLDQALSESGYTLIEFDNFLVVTHERDMTAIRLVPPRIVEEYLYDQDEEEEEDDVELEECESDEDEVEDEEDEEDFEDLDENGSDYGDEDIELGDIDSDKKKSE
jgi:hypothetical protein